MRYEDIIALTRQGNSRCLTIPARWLKDNKAEVYNYCVQIIIEPDRIQIFPLRSRWALKHPPIGKQDSIVFRDASTEKPEIKEEPAP